ncbi:MAG: DUF2513 domain-containing protein [Caldilineaceae bacterium]|nr:DUF2513 domain-containing protein [Caldilineaceae bacterium]
MAAIVRELDFDLCRRILLRMEELWESGTPSLPGRYCFEGYGSENISYNIEKLLKARLIKTTVPQNWTRGQLSIWPMGFMQNGRRFLEAAKDEQRWTEAIETVLAQDGPESLVPLKIVLFAERGRDRGQSTHEKN